jgi:hypothetical protein
LHSYVSIANAWLPLLFSDRHERRAARNANESDAIGDGADVGEALAQGEDLGKA